MNKKLMTKKNLFSDDYEINKYEVLGIGMNGRVLTCRNKHSNQKFALKIFQRTEQDPSLVKANQEITLHWRACQNSDYIVKVIDVYVNIIDGVKKVYLVTELMKGGELFKLLSSERESHFTEQQVAKMIYQIGSALKSLHSMNIAHFDLKPENLLLTKTNTGQAIIKLTDFGFAREIKNENKITNIGFTPYYVAPEILKMSEKCNQSCDIWSLGVIMFVLFYGKPPFYSRTEQSISIGMRERIINGIFDFPQINKDSNVSQSAKQLINRMLETDQDKRIKIDELLENEWIMKYNSL